MANNPGLTPTVIGNLTADPELRFTQQGTAVVNYTVAYTPRVFNKQSNQWEDGVTLFMKCTDWREAAENAAESFEKGSRVIVYGVLVNSEWTDREGNKQSRIEMDVIEAGPSTKFATAKQTKRAKRNDSQGGHGNQGSYSNQGAPNAGQSAPAASAAPAGDSDPWAAASSPKDDPWASV